MRKMVLLLTIIVFGAVGLSYGQTSKDAIKALKKLSAKVESGISYQKYREELGDTNAEVKLFLESKDANKDPQLALSVKKIMGNYQDAANLWGQFIESHSKLDFFDLDNAPEARKFYPSLIDAYQDALKKYPKAYDKVIKRPEMVAKRIIELKDLLAVIWGEASKELKKLSID